MKKYILILSLVALAFSACTDDGTDYYSDGSSGQGGSTARFAIKGDHLYAVNSSDLITFDISNPSNIQTNDELELDWGVETIFPYENYLFIGTMTGMHIMDISTPTKPDYLGTYEHIVSCDPVVVDGQYAYVTLHSDDNWCGASANELHVIDISKVLEEKNYSVDPEKVFTMTQPLGLGLTDDYLFVCDEELKVFDRSDPVNLVQLTSFDEVQNPTDVIPIDDRLLLIAESGFYQFSFANDDLTLLSHISVNQ